jgi:hypothetical protein
VKGRKFLAGESRSGRGELPGGDREGTCVGARAAKERADDVADHFSRFASHVVVWHMLGLMTHIE